MYERHFGLSVSPFTTSPDPRFLFFTSSHREALAGLMYGILNRKGFVSLIGDAGTGKTSLLRRVLETVDGNKSLVVNPSVAACDFTKLVMANFGISNIPSSKADQFIQFEGFLRQSQQDGKACVLVVDEAQRLSAAVLEEIRMLTNFELPEGKALQIVLAGQSELRDILNQPDLRQLKQRVAMRLTLKPLSGPEEVGSYVSHRWATAGGSKTTPFADEALELVAQYSAGVPRIVNVLCDNALLLAFAEEKQVVAVAEVMAAATELDLFKPAAPVAPPQPLQANGVHQGETLREAPLSENRRPASICPKLERVQPVRTRQSRIWGWFAK